MNDPGSAPRSQRTNEPHALSCGTILDASPRVTKIATSLDLRLTFNSYPLTRRLAGRLSFFGTLDQQIPGGIGVESRSGRNEGGCAVFGYDGGPSQPLASTQAC